MKTFLLGTGWADDHPHRRIYRMRGIYWQTVFNGRHWEWEKGTWR